VFPATLLLDAGIALALQLAEELPAWPAGTALCVLRMTRVKVRAFSTFHRLQSQGYAFIRTKTPLKAQFVGLSGEEIGKLVRGGIDVQDRVEVVELVCTGDTKVTALANDFVRQAKVVVTEATFLDDAVTVAEAQEKGHTHLAEIVAQARKEGK
jgi:ribonuclease Z